MQDNIVIFWIISGIIGFFINCGICYLISKPIEKFYKMRKKSETEKDKKMPQFLEIIIGLFWMIYFLGFVLAACYVLGFGIIVFRAFSENGVIAGIIAIIINLVSCIYISISPINYH